VILIHLSLVLVAPTHGQVLPKSVSVYALQMPPMCHPIAPVMVGSSLLLMYLPWVGGNAINVALAHSCFNPSVFCVQVITIVTWCLPFGVPMEPTRGQVLPMSVSVDALEMPPMCHPIAPVMVGSSLLLMYLPWVGGNAINVALAHTCFNPSVLCVQVITIVTWCLPFGVPMEPTRGQVLPMSVSVDALEMPPMCHPIAPVMVGSSLLLMYLPWVGGNAINVALAHTCFNPSVLCVQVITIVTWCLPFGVPMEPTRGQVLPMSVSVDALEMPPMCHPTAHVTLDTMLYQMLLY